MKETRFVGHNVIFLVLGQLAGIVISFLFVTLIPRKLGPGKLGQLSYWLSAGFILSAFLDFGTSFYNRYIPEFKVKEPGKVKALLLESLKIDGCIFLGLCVLIPLWLKVSWMELVVIFLGGIGTAVLSVFSQVFYSYEKLGYSSFIRNIVRLIRLVVILVALKLQVLSLLWAVFLPELITILIYSRSLKKILPVEKAVLPEGMKRYLSFGVCAYISAVSFMLLCRAPVILAKEMVGDLKIVGYVSMAVELSLYTIRIMAISIFLGALPSGLRYLASDDLNKFDRFLELSWKYGNMIIFPAVALFFILRKELIGFFIGKEYLGGVDMIAAFLPSAIILFWLQAHQHIFIIYEKKESLLYSSLISVLAFITLAMAMVTKIGVYGLPLSLAIGLFIGYVYAFCRTSSFERIRGYLPSILKPVVSGLVTTLIILCLKRTSMVALPFTIFLGAITYAISMFFLKGISKEDYLKVKAIIFS